MLAGQLALIFTAAYAGAAAYIMIVEHPVRLKMDDAQLMQHWKWSRKPGYKSRLALTSISFLLALWSWYSTVDWRWALGAGILFLNWPLRVAAIVPVNNKLQLISAKLHGDEMRRLLQHWGRLHMARVAIGVSATAIFAWALN